MATNFFGTAESAGRGARSRLDRPLHPAGRWAFLAILLGAIGYAAVSILVDTQHVGETLQIGVFLFLGLALLIALGFEFVNGFHDTANAVATVIYTNSMSPSLAVIWSGAFNFLGVIVSSGAVAYSIITLLPVELILHIGSAAGYAMIFALLFAAVVWNLATWFVGLPNSSSHALIGSILGVGLANQLLAGGRGGSSGVDWGQAEKVLSSLLFSPLMGFVGALLLLWVMKLVIRRPELYREPDRGAPPPKGIRALLIATCTAVSFAHGGNDGQKGMGLIMLILIGCAPTAYALNRTMPESATPAFVQSANQAAAIFEAHGGAVMPVDRARATLSAALQTKQAESPAVYGALDTVSRDVSARISGFGALSKVPAAATPNLRNDMYLVLDTSKLVSGAKDASARFSAGELKTLHGYEAHLQDGTRYIPFWVKAIVAIALGLGTMVGWKRIVVTVGERIGKVHMTYGMGASAEIVAAGTILLAQNYGLPVSTTHILTSGIAGSAVSNGSGLQRRTILHMVAAWLLTLPVAMLLSGGLYWLLLSGIRLAG